MYFRQMYNKVTLASCPNKMTELIFGDYNAQPNKLPYPLEVFSLFKNKHN